jgi:sugar transferase (PEP-CTERM/EpsH1 system associated)
MNVLYVSARFPWPPHRGDRLTGHQLIRALAREHRVTLASFTDGSEPPEGFSEIGRLCERVETVHLPPVRSWIQAFVGLASPTPSQVSYYESRTMRRRVAALVAAGKPDAIFVQMFRMAPFTRVIDHPCKVLFLGDSLAMSLERSLPFQPAWRRPGVRWEQRRVAAYEPRVARDFRECWVLSQVDARDLEARGCANLALLPHGVDESLFDLPLVESRPPRVTFLGNLSVPHNVDAVRHLARNVWPHIRAARPDAELEIVGADAVPAVRALASLPGVRVTGEVSTLLPVWARSGVAVAPVRFSSGIQNKVLEPMAAGVPVVTTPAVADAIGARDGIELRVGADAQSLAQAALKALAGGAENISMITAARERVRRNFSWQTLVDRLVALSKQPLEPARSTS